MNRLKLLSSIFILSFMIVIFSVVFFSFGTISLKKENTSLYNSNLVTFDNKSLNEESGWSLEQINTSSPSQIGNSSVILTDPEGNDNVYTWGSNEHGQLGIGEDTSYWTGEPSLVEFDMEYSDIKFLSTSSDYAMAVLTDESGKDFLYTWGDNSQGALGLGDSTKIVNKPKKVTGLEYDEIKSIDVGEKSTFIVLTMDGIDTMWSTGFNGDYRGSNHLLGLGDQYDDVKMVFNYTQIIFPEEHIKIISSDFGLSVSTVVVTNDNDENILYTWGENNDYQLNPDGSKALLYNSPIKYTYLPKEYTIEKIESSRFTTMALLVNKDGKEFLYSWGSNYDGVAGVGSTDNVIIEPTIVNLPQEEYTEIKDFDTYGGSSSAITIDSNGKEHFYLWGTDKYWLYGGSNVTDQTKPNKIDFPVPEYDYTIKEISLTSTYSAMIVDYNGSNQLYMWGTSNSGGIGSDNNDNNGKNTIENITVWEQTPMITFERGAPSVVNDNNDGKVLSFTLDWNKSSVTPTKLEIIDSNNNSQGEISLNEVRPGIETKINIEDIAPEGIDNVRLKVSDDNNTLVISQLFNIPESFLNKFDEPIEIDYNWMTAQKQLSFTLNYSSYNPLKSIKVYDNITTEPINIIIDYKTVINGEKYNIDISYLNNDSEITAYILAELENEITIQSENFIIPATKLKGWITILASSILLIVLIIVITFITIILKRKLENNKLNKMSKLKAKK